MDSSAGHSRVFGVKTSWIECDLLLALMMVVFEDIKLDDLWAESGFISIPLPVIPSMGPQIQEKGLREPTLPSSWY